MAVHRAVAPQGGQHLDFYCQIWQLSSSSEYPGAHFSCPSANVALAGTVLNAHLNRSGDRELAGVGGAPLALPVEGTSDRLTLGKCVAAAGIVLNALLNRSWNRELADVLQRRCVATNHFDVDSFLSVWCYINRQAAVEHEAGGGGQMH